MSHPVDNSAQADDADNIISYDEWKQQMGPSSAAATSAASAARPVARRGRPRKNPLAPPAPVPANVDEKSHKHHSKHKKKHHKHSSSRSPDGEHKHQKKHKKKHKKSHGHGDESHEKHKKKHKKKHHPADEDLAQIREAGAAAAAASLAETKPPKHKTGKKPHLKSSETTNFDTPDVTAPHPLAPENSLHDGEISESELDAEAAHIAASFTPFPGHLPRPPSSISLSTASGIARPRDHPPDDEDEDDFPFVDDSGDEDYVAGAYPPKFKKYKAGTSTSKLSGTDFVMNLLIC